MTDKPTALPDRVIVGPSVEPGSEAHHVIHMTVKDGEPVVGTGIMQPAKEGQAMKGTVVLLGEQRGISPLGSVYDAETLAEASPPRSREPVGHAGPAKVNSAAFREGWERVFGKSGNDQPN